MSAPDHIIWHEETNTPFCAGCGEILGQEEQDWGCAACGGDGFDEDDVSEDQEWHDYDADC